MGRPSKYRPEHLEQAEKLCKLGLTNEQLAEVWGVAPSTVDLWISKHDEFSGAVTRGRVLADANVAAALYERAIGYSHPETVVVSVPGVGLEEREVIKRYAPDVRAAEMWLHNRQRGRWRKTNDELPPPAGPITVNVRRIMSAD